MRVSASPYYRKLGGIKRAGAASTVGRPKSMIACLDPLRSASLATPATTKTRATSKRATSRAMFKSGFLSNQVRYHYLRQVFIAELRNHSYAAETKIYLDTQALRG
jgi:hypothetical protein